MPHHQFPPPKTALQEPDGLLAIGADLHPQRLLHAYRQGIFPWYNAGQPILWWSPDPRMVLLPEQLKISRSLKKSIRNRGYSVTFSQAFPDVIRACSSPRPPSSTHAVLAQQKPDEYATDTWLNERMIQAYTRLFALSYAHSSECWLEDQLVGGLYGVRIGQVFFGESMFHTQTDASKVALVAMVQRLQQQGCQLIDCQVYSEHMARLGAQTLPREQFLERIQRYT